MNIPDETPCCIYNGSFNPSIRIYPKDGIWTKRKFHEILKDCHENDQLEKPIESSNSSEGGFSWKGTYESNELWNKSVNNSYKPSPKSDALSIITTDYFKDREIRTYNTSSPDFDQNNIDLLLDEDADKSIQIDGPFYYHNRYIIPHIELKCKGNPPFKFLKILMEIFEKHGHIIFRTEHFKRLDDGTFIKSKGSTIDNCRFYKNIYKNIQQINNKF
jgi:hypothetical protein